MSAGVHPLSPARCSPPITSADGRPFDREFILYLCDKFYTVTNHLALLAEKDGCINEWMRLRLALERIASLHHEPAAKAMARKALRWD